MNPLLARLQKSVAIETSALDPHSLTPFGLYARWLFILGLYLKVQKLNNVEAMAEFKPLLDRAFAALNPTDLKMYQIREDWRTMARDGQVILSNYETINRFFNNYIKNATTIPMDEKGLFQKAIYLFKYNHLTGGVGLPGSAVDAMDKLAKQLSVKLGTAFAKAFRLNAGGAGSAGEVEGKNTVEALYTRLEELVKKITGKKGVVIPSDTIKELKLKADQPIDLLRYNDVRKELATYTKNALYLILSNGNLQADKAMKEMEQQGFRDFPFPTSKEGYKGFVGLDKEGKLALFTPGGKLIVGLVAPKSKVTMNPKYNEEKDDTYYFLFRAPGAVGDTRGYTASFRDIKTTAKHAKTTANTDKVGQWVKAWERDLFNKDPMRNVPATVALLLYLTSARIGTSKENQSKKGGAHTYGISTLRKQHVRIGSASIILDYVGKKGVHQKHTLKLDDKVNRRIAVILKRLLEGKKKDDLVFSFPRPTSRTGAMQEVNPTFFRSYLKMTGVTINPHALRHIRGTALAVELMNANPWKPSVKAKTLVAKQREAELFLKDRVLKKVATLLGHKTMKNGVEQELWSTSVKSYIDPSVIVSWFKDKELAIPRWVPKKLEE